MKDQGGRLLRQRILQGIRGWQSAVIDAQAGALRDRRHIARTFRDFPPGWSLGVRLRPSRELREQAFQQLTRVRSPLRAALRALHQSESDHDVRFLKLLWEDRPQLVAAVALYARLERAPLHPDVYHREVREKRLRLAGEHLESRLAEGRLFDGMNEAIDTLGDTRREAERLDAHLLQLELLGWGRWRVPEGKLEPTEGPGRGGGEPMPRWTLSIEPTNLDGSKPDVADGGWWYVDGAPSDANTGKNLWTHTVSAIMEALGLSGRRNDRDLREPIAHHLPDVFSERRDPSPGGPIKDAVDNLRRGAETA